MSRGTGTLCQISGQVVPSHCFAVVLLCSFPVAPGPSIVHLMFFCSWRLEGPQCVNICPLASTFPHPPCPLPDNHKSAQDQPNFFEQDERYQAGRRSPLFDTLLPGMGLLPLGVIPKPHLEKLRLITIFCTASATPSGLLVMMMLLQKAKDDWHVVYDNCCHCLAATPCCQQTPSFMLS